MTGQTKKRKKTGQPAVYSAASDLCVWSRAGVVKPIACLNAFDCLGCAFDQKVQSNFQTRQPAGARALADPRPMRMHLLVNQRKCRHMLSGRVTYKLCGHGYDCARCPYDQMLEDNSVMKPLTPPVCESAAGFDVARDYYFHPGHTWARVEYGGRIRVGVDDFAIRLLGPQDRIEMPKLGETVGQNRPHAVMIRGSHKAYPLSPVDGKVLAVNPHIHSQVHTANDDPYGKGWLMVIQPVKLRDNLKNLLFGDESVAWMEDEASRLTTLLSEATGYKLAATGGEAVRDIFGTVPNADWDQLVQEFLV
jgi:glycine cleavage system H lipoate-binding protein